jgi:hypothetical protein
VLTCIVSMSSGVKSDFILRQTCGNVVVGCHSTEVGSVHYLEGRRLHDVINSAIGLQLYENFMLYSEIPKALYDRHQGPVTLTQYNVQKSFPTTLV